MFNLLCYGSPALRETEEVCRELGVTIIAYSPIGQGLLTRDLTQEKFETIRVAKMAGIGLGDLDPLRCEVARLAGAARQEHGAGLPELGRLPWGGAARGVPQRGAGPRQRRGPRVEALARRGRGPRCRCPEHEHFGEAAVAPGPLCGVYLLVDAELQGLGGL